VFSWHVTIAEVAIGFKPKLIERYQARPNGNPNARVFASVRSPSPLLHAVHAIEQFMFSLNIFADP